jgi:hypothetical protein
MRPNTTYEASDRIAVGEPTESYSLRVQAGQIEAVTITHRNRAVFGREYDRVEIPWDLFVQMTARAFELREQLEAMD